MINIDRDRYVCIRERNGKQEIWSGLARDFSFKEVDNLKGVAIKTYESETKARSSCSYWHKNDDPTFKIVKIRETISDEDTAFWIFNPNGLDWNIGAWECSVCHSKNDNLPNSKDNIPNLMLFQGSKFCPQCGRKIVGMMDVSNR